MKKMGKKLIALTAVFACLMSFLPLPFNNNGTSVKAANAPDNITVTADNQTVEQSVTDDGGQLVKSNDWANSFVVSVDTSDVLSESELNSQVAVGETGVLERKIIIKSIDGIDVTQNVDGTYQMAQEIGCSIEEKPANKKMTIIIKNLPLGMNTIEYVIQEKQAKNEGLDDSGIQNSYRFSTSTVNTNSADPLPNKLYIEHGNSYVQNKISSIDFDAYIGQKAAYREDSTDNTVPFLYTIPGISDEECKLKYSLYASDKVDEMSYHMNFGSSSINFDDAQFFRKGQKIDISVDKSSATVTGSIKDPRGKEMIVLYLPNDKTDGFPKTYAMEINIKTLKTTYDATLRNAGITKYKYNDDSSVKAYIGKKFVQEENTGVVQGEDNVNGNDYPVYDGTINVDSRAGLISLEPKLGKEADETAFKIRNNYSGSSGNGTSQSRLIDGKQYVDFMAGENNTIQLDVYEGNAGNPTGKILARYNLKVNIIKNGTSDVEFEFPNGVLTQPGRPISESLTFDQDRRTYNLYRNTGEDVKINLTKPSTEDNGKRREFIKAWAGSDLDSDDGTLLTSDENPTASIVIPKSKIEKAKKIILQACYEQKIISDDGSIQITTSKIGPKYIFYLPENIDDDENVDTVKSDDASLKDLDLQVPDGTLRDTDGNTGFSSDSTNYVVTVPKNTEDAKLTVTANSSKVSSISLKIRETGEEYNIESGKRLSIALNEKGKTSMVITVTAEDKITTKKYEVIISKDIRNSSSTLRNIILNKGYYTFNPDKDDRNTIVRVDTSVSEIKILPVPEESGARIKVDGTNFKGSPIVVSLRGEQKTNVTVKVTSEDGTKSTVYTLDIYRSDSELPDDIKDDDDDDDVFYDDIDDVWVDKSKYEEWGKIDGKEIYFDSRGRQSKDRWVKQKYNLYYYLDSDGYRKKGWFTETDGKTYYLDEETGALKTGWIYQNNNYYYLDDMGVMHKGWLNMDNNWYYFTPNGQLVTNKEMFVDYMTYRFGPDGAIY
ncbi:cadherin-like beta sandwich domain-containing protein [Clostridium sp. BJN0001]|uniref:cadherin-like beta sandwich domain-containing protein n=1 Tax=Clostridium sp. BJN0001 TaxID=2930219 RepID=UPI001FD306A7|nr:cadherin-like beta sandwich domain-containing protein [Clostridium sp. BJN0001]